MNNTYVINLPVGGGDGADLGTAFWCGKTLRTNPINSTIVSWFAGNINQWNFNKDTRKIIFITTVKFSLKK